jgi:transposase, IS5 family
MRNSPTATNITSTSTASVSVRQAGAAAADQCPASAGAGSPASRRRWAQSGNGPAAESARTGGQRPTELLDATRQIAAQTRQRLAGLTPDGATRRISLYDSDARPIAKGRLGKPIEFGYKAQLIDNDDGIVVDHTIEPGNPADAPRLAPAVERVIKRTGRTPRTVTADRGYGEKSVENNLHEMGCAQGRDPPQGPTHQGQTSPGTPPGIPANSEMANRKRRQNQHPQTRIRLGPTRIDSTEGARIWTGHGVLAHNLVKISALVA